MNLDIPLLQENAGHRYDEIVLTPVAGSVVTFDPVKVLTPVAYAALLSLLGGQPAGNYIIALTGDVLASGPGSAVAVLSNTGVVAGNYSSANISVDSKGRIIAASDGAGSGGTVTDVAVATANGVSGSVATPNTTPTITLTLAAITPTSVVASSFITTPSLKSAALANLIIGTGTFGTSITFASATGIPTFATAVIITGKLTPNGGIVGVANNGSTAAGNVGEFVSSLVPFGSAISLTNNTTANVTSISLTAGDWDVEGNVSFGEQLATIIVREASISTTSATIATDGLEGYFGYQTTTTSATNTITLTRKRISIGSTTTVYLTALVAFLAGTVIAWGGITARRVR